LVAEAAGRLGAQPNAVISLIILLARERKEKKQQRVFQKRAVHKRPGFYRLFTSIQRVNSAIQEKKLGAKTATLKRDLFINYRHRTRTNFGDRAYSAAGPRVWNSQTAGLVTQPSQTVAEDVFISSVEPKRSVTPSPINCTSKIPLTY